MVLLLKRKNTHHSLVVKLSNVKMGMKRFQSGGKMIVTAAGRRVGKQQLFHFNKIVQREATLLMAIPGLRLGVKTRKGNTVIRQVKIE